MKVHRFFTEKIPASGATHFTLSTSGIIQQITKVLKLHVSEVIEIFDGMGAGARLKIKKIDKDGIECDVLSVFQASEDLPKITAYISLLKRDNFELIVQKLTEIGIAEIVPILTARTIKTSINMTRLEVIAREAAELSGRTTLPKISSPVEFKKIISAAGARAIFFDVVEKKSNKKPVTAQSFFIGPEGGWTPDEVAAANEAGCTFKQMGPLTLRGETAAIIGAYATIYNLCH